MLHVLMSHINQISSLNSFLDQKTEIWARSERQTDTSRLGKTHRHKQGQKDTQTQTGSERHTDMGRLGKTNRHEQGRKDKQTRAESERQTDTSRVGKTNRHKQSRKDKQTRAESERQTDTSRVRKTHRHKQGRKDTDTWIISNKYELYQTDMNKVRNYIRQTGSDKCMNCLRLIVFKYIGFVQSDKYAIMWK